MWSWFFPKVYSNDDIYNTMKYHKYSSDNTHNIACIKNTIPHYPKIHIKLLESFIDGDILESNIELVKMMLKEWPEDLCDTMKMLLTNNNVLAAMAIGREKNADNAYFNLIKNNMNMTYSEFRKHIVELRKLWDVVPRSYPQTIPYTICLHNEPLNYKINNHIIYTCYRDIIKMHEYMYDPVETRISTPLSKPIWNYIKQRPLVIITNNIDAQIDPPTDVYLIYTESTKSWGQRILPFFNEKGYSTIRNFIDFYNSINILPPYSGGIHSEGPSTS